VFATPADTLHSINDRPSLPLGPLLQREESRLSVATTQIAGEWFKSEEAKKRQEPSAVSR